MSRQTIQNGILNYLYQKWVEDPFQLVNLSQIINEGVLDVEENILEANAGILVDLGLIAAPMTTAYTTRITIDGINSVEDRKFSIDSKNRRKILEFMKLKFEENSKRNLNKDMIKGELELSEIVVRRNIWYLEKMGLIDVSWYLGAGFTASINAFGLRFLEEPTELEHESEVMSSAYSLLYQLENEVRALIQQKLIEKYNENWWNSGIPLEIRRRAEQKKEQDRLSEYDFIYYIDFGDLRRIIINNWDLFREIFHTQGGTLGRLEELEEIRNNIAHTRLLTVDGLEKLNMFHRDILTLLRLHD